MYELIFTATSTTTQFRLTNGANGSISYYEADNVVIDISNNIGEWFNLGTDQPYVPVLKGGAPDRSNDPLKAEVYNGNHTTGTFVAGVDTTNTWITSLGPDQVGSYLGQVGVGLAIETGDIIVAKNGSVIQATEVNANTYLYVELQ
jgi:hypothetical protein